MDNYNWVWFVLGTAACWGAYGPSIHEGQLGLGSPWKAFFLVGAAYFLLAVLVPGAILLVRDPEPFRFTGGALTRGTTWALIAGALGALGALGVIAAMRTGGKPFYVMPLVFGLAPVVNVLVSRALHPPKNAIDPRLWIGLGLLAIGAGLVLRYKPS
jgi:hypothetical protein